MREYGRRHLPRSSYRAHEFVLDQLIWYDEVCCLSFRRDLSARRQLSINGADRVPSPRYTLAVL